jgi:CheY-like chemotaxis protein
MPETQTRLLIVDDEPSVRASMSQVLSAIGYQVRSAEDGFSALAEIRKEVPDILLSDLVMAGMSGHELLSVVRRRFPSIQVIAMSGAFSGDEAPSGVAADAFYQKGSSVGSLLKLLAGLPKVKRRVPRRPSAALTPIWIQRGGSKNEEEACVTIACPECLRTFPQLIGNSINLLRQADCIYCHSLIPYGIVQPAKRPPISALQRAGAEEKTQAAALPQFFY